MTTNPYERIAELEDENGKMKGILALLAAKTIGCKSKGRLTQLCCVCDELAECKDFNAIVYIEIKEALKTEGE